MYQCTDNLKKNNIKNSSNYMKDFFSRFVVYPRISGHMADVKVKRTKNHM